MTKNENGKIKLAVMATDILYIKKSVEDISKKLETSYVTKSEFSPVKKIVFGLIGIMLTSVFVALLSLVLKK